MNELEATKADIAAAKQRIKKQEKEHSENLKAKTFNTVTVIVLGAFAINVFSIVAIVTVGFWMEKDSKEPVQQLFELLKIGVVPLTATIIGYYISRRGML